MTTAITDRSAANHASARNADGFPATITDHSAANHADARNADGFAAAITDHSAANDGGATNTSGFAAAITDRSATHDGCTTRAHGVAATITDRSAAHDGGAMTCFHNAGDETSNKAEDYDRVPHTLSFRARMSLCECLRRRRRGKVCTVLSATKIGSKTHSGVWLSPSIPGGIDDP